MIAGTAISVFLAYNSIKSVVYKHYKTLITQHIDQANKNVQLYMNLIEETAEYFSSDPVLVACLNKQKFDNRVISILDGLRSTNLNILGVSLYTSAGINYTSSNVANIPSLQWIIENELSPLFISETNQQSIWIIRYGNLHDFYHTYYNKQNGLLSYICKANNSQKEPVGFLIIDTNINTLYNFYKNGENSFFHLINYYIVTNGGSVLTTFEKADADLKYATKFHAGDSPQVILQADNYVILSSPIPSCDATIVLHFSLDKINHQFFQLRIILTLLFILFTVISIILARSLAYSISSPLDILYYKMEDFLSY